MAKAVGLARLCACFPNCTMYSNVIRVSVLHVNFLECYSTVHKSCEAEQIAFVGKHASNQFECWMCPDCVAFEWGVVRRHQRCAVHHLMSAVTLQQSAAH